MKLGVPSMEFIKLQDNSLFNELTNIIKNIRAIGDLKTKTVFESGLERAIFDRLGLSIEARIIQNAQPNASMELPTIDRNHVFVRLLTTYPANYVGKTISYFQDDSMRIGGVDMANCRLSGIFSKIPLTMTLNTGLFERGFADDEIAAVILHELGHGFSFFYYLMHTAIANYISCSVATSVMGADSDKERIVMIEQGLRFLGVDGVAVKPMIAQTPEQIAAGIQTLYINSTLNNLRTETGFGMYEIRACEQIADWFASKFGAAVASARVQEKLIAYSRKPQAPKARSRSFLRTATLYGVYIIQFAIPFPKFMADMFIDDTIDMYDRGSDRIRYMRHALIDELRDSDIDPAIAKKLIADIDEITKIEDSVKEGENTFRKTVLTFLRNKLVPNYRRNVSAVALQKTLEEAMYNDSYLHAAKFKGVQK